ncbi:MAG: CARDB domain-containing protein [Bacteroidia bacterium]
MKTKIILLVVLGIVGMSGSCSLSLYAQNEYSKPKMKITIKNGKIVESQNVEVNNESNTVYQKTNVAKTTSSFDEKSKQFIEKGKLLPAIDEPAGTIFNISEYMKILPNKTVKKSTDFKQNVSASKAGWSTIMSEGFESSFPSSGWSVYANSGYTDAYWNDVNYISKSGTWSSWCANGGTAGINPSSGHYLNNMKSWMIYGPFDLSDATAGNLSFYLNNNTESTYDKFQFMVSLNGTDYYGYENSGTTSGWAYKTLDFTNVYTLGNICGYSQVYIALIFESDVSNNNYAGAFVDDIVVEKFTQTLPNLHVSAISSSSENWCSGNSITVGVTEDNLGEMTAGSHLSDVYLSTNTTISTSDTYLGEIAFGSILGNSSDTEYLTFYAPNLSYGTYYIGVIADVYNNVTESDGSDNTVYRINPINVGSFPDLSWTDLTLSKTNWSVGNTITANLTESNTGSAYASSHYTDLYLSTNEIISTGDTYLGELNFSGILSNGSQTKSLSFVVPTMPDNTYWMGAIVDSYNTVAESDETNNYDVRTGTITVVNPTAIDNIENKLYLKTYPNPVTNMLIIEQVANSGKADYEIYNSIGKIVDSGAISEKTIVSTSAYSKGMYLLKVQSESSVNYRKFLVK